MSSRIDPSVRKAIKEDPRPRRVVAAELGVSKTTVQMWKHRKVLEDLPRMPKTPKGIKPFEIELFAEFLRLTRYRYQYLFEYLGPAWSKLPTAERIDCRREGAYWRDSVSGRFVNKLYSPSSFFRKLKERDQGCHLQCFERDDVPAGTVTAHRIRVEWRGSESEIISGEILLLIERHSGLIFAKAFTDRISPPSFGVAFKHFSQMLPYQIQTLTFVSSKLETKPNSGKWERFSTLFRLRADRKTENSKKSRPIAKHSREELEEYCEDHCTPPAKLFIDPETPAQLEVLKLPGRYVDRPDLNKVLANLCNLINLTPRKVTSRWKIVQVCPLERIREELKRAGKPKTRSQLRRKLELPRKFRP